MLHLPLLLSVLSAVPHAPADAPTTLYVPKLDAVAPLLPFFRSAGQRSLLLRPESWRTELHPLLETDFTDSDSLAASGIDASGALSVSKNGQLVVSCVQLKDVKKYTAAADARLLRWGDLTHKTISGVATTYCTDAIGRVQGGYSLKGNEVCAFTAGGLSLEKQLQKLAAVVTKPAAAPGFAIIKSLPGNAFFVHAEDGVSVASGLTGAPQSLTVDAESRGLDGAGLAGSGASPFANAKPEGMSFVRARLSPSGVLNAMNTLAGNTPNGRVLRDAVPLIAPLLTGNVIASATSVRPRASMRTTEARYFAAQITFVAEVKDAEALKPLIEAIDLSKLKFKEGTVDVGLQGNLLYFSNSTVSRDAVLAAITGESGGKQAHAVEFKVNPKGVAKGLSQVPLLEAMQSPEAAILLGISAELGPLLNVSDSISGFIDSTGMKKQKAQFTWQLSEPSSAVP